MKNRKKELRLKKRRNTTTHIVHHLHHVRFYRIKLHYVALSDSYICELFCTINNDRLSIKGVIDVMALPNNIIKLDASQALKGGIYNATTIALARKDAPHFYAFVEAFIYNTADALDAGSRRPPTITIEEPYGFDDSRLELERTNLDHVFQIENK